MPWSDFHFIRPWWILALLPLAGVLLALLRRPPAAGPWEKVCDPALLDFLRVGGSGGGLRWPWLLLGLGWLLAVLALAGPTWARLPQPVYKAQVARILVVDLSRTMDAGDLRPSRLVRARFKLMDVLARSREGQVGLVAFSGEPYVIAPLTNDAHTITAMVPALESGVMPVQGRRTDLALAMAGDLLEQAGATHGDVLLISDGVAPEAAAMRKARALAARGHRLSVLAVGTPEGAPVATDSGFLKDDTGNTVIARLDVPGLRALAEAGGGAFSLLSADDRDLRRVLPAMRRGSAEMVDTGINADQWREEGHWLVLLLLPLALAGFRRGWLLGVVLAVSLAGPGPVMAFGWADLWARADQQGADALEAGDPEAAAARFRDPLWQATALYRAGHFEEAAQAFAGSDTADALYDRGNALARAGQLEEARAAYAQALERDPGHQDAAFNRRLVEALLDQRRKQSQQEKQNNEQTGSGMQDQHGREQGQPQTQGNRNQGQGQGQGDEGRTKNGEPGEGGRERHAEGESGGEDQRSGSGEGHDEAGRQATGNRSTRGQDRDTDRLGAPKNAVGPGSRQAAEQSAKQVLEGPVTGEGDARGEMALEQWLRRIPDDPAGLLRRKLSLEHRRRQAAAE